MKILIYSSWFAQFYLKLIGLKLNNTGAEFSCRLDIASECFVFFALGLFGSRFSTECHVSLYLFGDLTSVIFPMIDGQKRRDFLVVERTIRKNYK